MSHTYVKTSCVSCPSLAKGVSIEDVEWLKERNLDLALACPRCVQEISLDEAHWLQERRLGLALICKDCGEPFLTSPDEVVWLLTNELKLFKRCSVCRQSNREKKELLEMGSTTIDELQEDLNFVGDAIKAKTMISDIDFENTGV
jgi:uncharacterized protein YbaR (Trm112 family)